MPGGAGWIRTPGAARASMGGIRPSLAHYSARQKASVLERICSPGIRLCFGSLRFASFARLKADARRRRTSDQKLWVQIRAPVGHCWPEFLPRSRSSTARVICAASCPRMSTIANTPARICRATRIARTSFHSTTQDRKSRGHPAGRRFASSLRTTRRLTRTRFRDQRLFCSRYANV